MFEWYGKELYKCTVLLSSSCHKTKARDKKNTMQENAIGDTALHTVKIQILNMFFLPLSQTLLFKKLVRNKSY